MPFRSLCQSYVNKQKIWLSQKGTWKRGNDLQIKAYFIKGSRNDHGLTAGLRSSRESTIKLTNPTRLLERRVANEMYRITIVHVENEAA